MLEAMISSVSPMVLFWLAGVILFAAAEAATVGLISLWFAGGSLVALITACLGGPVWLQVVLFFAVSIVLLALLRPFIKKVSVPYRTRTNADRHIGQSALVTEEINNLKETGAVRLDGVTWTARSENGQVIPEGSLVEIKKIAGVKVIVALKEVAAAL